MCVDFKDEYATLRQEMLERFGRIHDTGKYGIGAFIAFLSYYYTHPNFDDSTALIIFQLLVALMGFSCLNLYRHIYRIGTYIAFVIEKTGGVRWHRMSRSLDNYKKKFEIVNIFNKSKRLLPFPLGTRWGEDPAQLALLLLILMVIGLGAVFSKITTLSEFLPLCTSQWYFLVITIVVFTCNVIVIYKLLWGMRNYKDNIVKTWKKYNKKFGTQEFPDPYADP
jgi:hypothetical protein